MPASLVVRIFFWLWFGSAIAAGHFLWLQRVPPAAVPAVAFPLAALVLLGCFRLSSLRAWVDDVDVRVLILLHATRYIGVYLLHLYQRGELPRAFAVPAGVTDVLIATMALPIAFAPLEDAVRRRAIVIWNVVGFVGLLLATVSAIRINLVHPMPLRALTHLPLSLIPTFLTPLLLVLHIIIFDRMRQLSRKP